MKRKFSNNLKETDFLDLEKYLSDEFSQYDKNNIKDIINVFKNVFEIKEDSNESSIKNSEESPKTDESPESQESPKRDDLFKIEEKKESSLKTEDFFKIEELFKIEEPEKYFNYYNDLDNEFINNKLKFVKLKEYNTIEIHETLDETLDEIEKKKIYEIDKDIEVIETLDKIEKESKIVKNDSFESLDNASTKLTYKQTMIKNIISQINNLEETLKEFNRIK